MSDVFDLHCGRSDGGYWAQVLASPAGESDVVTLAVLDPIALAAEASSALRELYVTAASGPDAWRRLDVAPVESRLAEVGTNLFEAVFTGQVLDRYRSSRALSRDRGRRLTVRLRSQDDDLWELPWEYLYDPGDGGRYEFASPDVAFVRYLEAPSPVTSLDAPMPLKILVATSNPFRHDPRQSIDVESEWTGLTDELGSSMTSGRVIIDRIDGATLADLVDHLNEDEYHVMHYIGHGGFDAAHREGYIMLESRDGSTTGRKVFAKDLAQHVGGHRSLRLVVLNCCASAVADSVNSLGGAAQALVRATLPAVIAMRSTIFDKTAVRFAASIYKHIVQGQPVDEAMSRTRGRLLAADGPERLEWGTPLLYLRTTDSVLFNVREPVAHELDALRHAAKRLADRGRFDGAENRLTALVAWLGDDTEARDDLAVVRRRRDAARTASTYLAEGDTCARDNDLDGAMTYYHRAKSLNAGLYIDRQADARLQLVRRRKVRPQTVRGGASVDGADLNVHMGQIIGCFEHGDLTLFFGPDVIMASRDDDHVWVPERDVPTYAELAEYLVRTFKSVEPEPRSIARIAQYLSASEYMRLEAQLHTLFRHVMPTTVHHALANIFEDTLAKPAIMMSSNYDDLLVRAYEEQRRSFDLLSFSTRYDDDGPAWRGFVHTRYQDGEPGQPVEIREPNTYQDVQPGVLPCIVKMYGMVDRQSDDPARDTLVVSEDQHLRYVREERISRSLPTTVLNALKRSHHLFLGQNLRDWTVRGAFSQIVRAHAPIQAWVVQPGVAAEERTYWEQYVPNVTILDIGLSDFVTQLRERLAHA